MEANSNTPSSAASTSCESNGPKSSLSPLRLVVLGWRWPGKSLTANTILGREEFRLERAAEFCVTRHTEVAGRPVTVVDTPGWYSSQDTPLSYKKEIARGATLCPPGPHAFLLVIPVGMFTEVDRARIEEHVGLFGERVWRHVLVVFTWAEVLRTISLERYIRREGADLQRVLEKCRRRYMLINNCVFEEQTQVGRLMERVDRIVAEEGGHFLPEEPPALDQNRNLTGDATRQPGAGEKANDMVTLAKNVSSLSTQ
ncbi:GTPase IMAP family member 4 isoform X1 [Hippocampus zosterae]|uniref:GTPase IMAP family member 4 isoform X1 n=1 Tax=Hippocampus zosterae TaxID=109293 RepID=UPI00223DE144|nr:GTPase IMAP family member 4 isoform X1 [Hippocampus zosterae]